MQFLSNAIVLNKVAPSPLRSSNYDLLQLLSLHESVHRALRKYASLGEEKDVSFEWLRDFYTSRVSTYFDGYGRYGRADDFLTDLFMSPPSTKTTSDGKIGLIDPLAITEDIIEMRSEVVSDWIEIMKLVPQIHMSLRAEVFNQQFSSSDSTMQLEEEFSSVEPPTGGIFE